MENEIEISYKNELGEVISKLIDTVIVRPNDSQVGMLDGSKDSKGNYHKVTADGMKVDYSVEKGGGMVIKNWFKNWLGDMAKRLLNLLGDDKLLSGEYRKDAETEEDENKYNRLDEAWRDRINDEVGDPSEWAGRYESNEQKALREKLNEEAIK